MFLAEVKTLLREKQNSFDFLPVLNKWGFGMDEPSFERDSEGHAWHRFVCHSGTQIAAHIKVSMDENKWKTIDGLYDGTTPHDLDVFMSQRFVPPTPQSQVDKWKDWGIEGPSGNVFDIIKKARGIIYSTLGHEEAEKFRGMAFASHSYGAVIALIAQYFHPKEMGMKDLTKIRKKAEKKIAVKRPTTVPNAVIAHHKPKKGEDGSDYFEWILYQIEQLILRPPSQPPVLDQNDKNMVINAFNQLSRAASNGYSQYHLITPMRHMRDLLRNIHSKYPEPIHTDVRNVLNTMVEAATHLWNVAL